MSPQVILVEATRVSIVLSILVIGFGSLRLSSVLNQRIRPLSEKLIRLHQTPTEAVTLEGDLGKFEKRYQDLMSHTDDVDTAEFSAGLIETLELRFLGRSLTVASAQSWVKQSPSLLISLGLLGTFAGLTVGLNQIGGILTNELNPSAAMSALSTLMTPMAAAFETSLLGLLFSLLVLIWTQLTGTRTCLERCEALLSSWLETVLPQQLGAKLMTPLRQSLNELNETTKGLPAALSSAVSAAMQSAFRAKLNDLFDVQVNLAAEAATAVHNLSIVASNLNESGQDFVKAAEAFRQSDFASTLHLSVMSLVETRAQLTSSTEALSKRLFEVRDSLLFTQSEWKLLAKAAETELEFSQQVGLMVQDEIKALHSAAELMQQSTNAATESTKQLREARLEVMRDRKLAIEAVAAIQERLATDNSTAESCKAFVTALENSLHGWSTNLEQLNALSLGFVESVRKTQLEDNNNILERGRLATETIAQLQEKMLKDLGQSIENQRLRIVALGAPAHSAKSAAENLLTQLEELQRRVSALNLPDVTTSIPSSNLRG
ncbi:MAG: hypothetical protein ACK46L_13680 [Synechococcaceae cyanobacterium]